MSVSHVLKLYILCMIHFNQFQTLATQNLIAFQNNNYSEGFPTLKIKDNVGVNCFMNLSLVSLLNNYAKFIKHTET